MIQRGGLLSGFSLYALFTWLPIWRLATAGSAESIFRYFVVMMMLLFGVFMISGGKNSFSLLKFSPAFLAGALISVGYAASTRSEEHTFELQSLMRISYAVFCLKQKK